jgi:hypothetical protein
VGTFGQLKRCPLSPAFIPFLSNDPKSIRSGDHRCSSAPDDGQQDSGDRLQFLSLMSILRSDKEMRVGEMNDLVTRLTKVPTKLKNKKAALEANEAWSQRKLDTQRRLGSTEDLF